MPSRSLRDRLSMSIGDTVDSVKAGMRERSRKSRETSLRKSAEATAARAAANKPKPQKSDVSGKSVAEQIKRRNKALSEY